MLPFQAADVTKKWFSDFLTEFTWNFETSTIHNVATSCNVNEDEEVTLSSI